MPSIEEVSEMMGELAEDPSVPKNIRNALTEAKGRLDGDEDKDVKVSAAIYIIEPITDDINMPAHARTQIWSIMSALESLSEETE